MKYRRVAPFHRGRENWPGAFATTAAAPNLEGTAPLLAGAGTRSTVDFTGALVEAMASFSIGADSAEWFDQAINFDLVVAPITTAQKVASVRRTTRRSSLPDPSQRLKSVLEDPNRANARRSCYGRQRSRPCS